MKKSVVNLERGEFRFDLLGEELVLKGSFENIARFEEFIDRGIYEFSANFMAGNDIRLTHIVAMIFCFLEKRDTEGYSYNELGEKLRKMGIHECLPLLQQFFQVIFAIEEMAELKSELPDDDSTKKKVKT